LCLEKKSWSKKKNLGAREKVICQRFIEKNFLGIRKNYVSDTALATRVTTGILKINF